MVHMSFFSIWTCWIHNPFKDRCWGPASVHSVASAQGNLPESWTWGDLCSAPPASQTLASFFHHRKNWFPPNTLVTQPSLSSGLGWGKKEETPAYEIPPLNHSVYHTWDDCFAVILRQDHPVVSLWNFINDTAMTLQNEK